MCEGTEIWIILEALKDIDLVNEWVLGIFIFGHVKVESKAIFPRENIFLFSLGKTASLSLRH